MKSAPQGRQAVLRGTDGYQKSKIGSEGGRGAEVARKSAAPRLLKHSPALAGGPVVFTYHAAYEGASGHLFEDFSYTGTIVPYLQPAHQWSGTPPTSKEEEHMSAVIRTDGTVLEGPDQEQVMTTTHDEITTVDDLTTWTEARVLMLAEDGGTLPFLRGYADYASGKTPDSASVDGLPFEACDYHEGYALASYELGNPTTTEEMAT